MRPFYRKEIEIEKWQIQLDTIYSNVHDIHIDVHPDIGRGNQC